MTVRTRIPPSPTGEELHIGNLYTALLNWTWAKKHNGKFIVRIEDTDKTREVLGSEEQILKALKLYGLDYDEGPDNDGKYAPYRQSERLDIYKKYAEELVQKGAAYYCNCSKERLEELRKKQQAEKKVPKYDKHCLRETHNVKRETQEPHVVRLNVEPGKTVSFDDIIHGTITFKTEDIDDQVLLKSDGYPTYHLANVVDDHLMKITHVVRGEEWISSTPKHVFLYQAFGWDAPAFAHTPLLRNPDKSKLSKRKNPVWATWYLEQGYLPEAVLNYLSLMGWSHPEQKEIFDLEEFIKVFELKDIEPVGPVFDIVKLEWLNGEWIRKSSIVNLKSRLLEFYKDKFDEKLLEKTIPLIQERIKKLSDYEPLCKFFFEAPKEYEVDLNPHKDLLKKIHDELQKITDWKADKVGEAMQNLAKREGVKNSEFFMILRIAVTGRRVSPPLNESMEVLGKKESSERITT